MIDQQIPGVNDLFDISSYAHNQIFKQVDPSCPWQVLSLISVYISSKVREPLRKQTLIGAPYIQNSPLISIGQGTTIEHGAMIKAPAIIGKNCEIRNGAYLRGNVIMGDGCVIGNSTELKNCVLLDRVQVPHFNYVGDSILGNGAHLGAGVILSNVRLDTQNISVGGKDTGLMKFGALLGDYAEVGCNSVLNPGSIIGKKSVVYPGSVWKGALPSYSILKTTQTHSIVRRNPTT